MRRDLSESQAIDRTRQCADKWATCSLCGRRTGGGAEDEEKKSHLECSRERRSDVVVIVFADVALPRQPTPVRFEGKFAVGRLQGGVAFRHTTQPSATLTRLHLSVRGLSKMRHSHD